MRHYLRGVIGFVAMTACFCIAIDLGMQGRYWTGQIIWMMFCGILAAFMFKLTPRQTRGPAGDTGEVVSRWPRVERFLWIGDGFDCGSDQVGRRVNLHGRKGEVIAGTALTIDVKFD